jgi:hypothetical protein
VVAGRVAVPAGKKLSLSLASGNNIPLRYKDVKEIRMAGIGILLGNVEFSRKQGKR